MAYTPVPTVATGDLWTAANHNAYIRDNFAAGAPDVFTTKGDLFAATGADAGVRVGVSGTDGALLAEDSSGSAGMAWETTLLVVGNKVFLGDNANANLTQGLTLNQGAADDEILALKSSDVAHGMTDLTETDTYGEFGKYLGTKGGLAIIGYQDSDASNIDPGLALVGVKASVAADTTKAVSSGGAIKIEGDLKSGTGASYLGANGNILAVADFDTTRFILDADGDSHQDVGTAWTNFDDQDDAALLTALSVHVSRADDPIRGEFARFLRGHKRRLAALKLVTFNRDGHHFVNMSRLTMLLVGAVRQTHARLERIERILEVSKVESGKCLKLAAAHS